MKIQLIALLFLISFSAIAQNQKGDWALSLSASPYPIEVKGEKDFGAIGLAQLEFFTSSKVSLSTSFLTSNNGLFKNNSNEDLTSYGIMPGAQYYFINNQKYNVFGQVAYGLGFKSDSTTDIDNEALRIYSIGAGGHYKINDTLKAKLFFPYFNAKDLTFNRNEISAVAVFLGLQFKL